MVDEKTLQDLTEQIVRFKGSSFRKSLDILNRLDPHFPIDLIARRPDETAKRYAQGGPLIREALDKGKALYGRRQ